MIAFFKIQPKEKKVNRMVLKHFAKSKIPKNVLNVIQTTQIVFQVPLDFKASPAA